VVEGRSTAPILLLDHADPPLQDALVNTALQQAGFNVRIDNRRRTSLPAEIRMDTLDEGTEARIARHPPRLIVGFGNRVNEWLLGAQWPRTKRGTAEDSQNVRGYLWDTPRGRVLTSMHPDAIKKEWTPWRVLLDLDMQKVQREWRAHVPDLPERQVTIVTTIAERDELFHAIASEVGGKWWGGAGALAKAQTALVAVDIENDHDLKLSCLGVAPTVDRAWVIPAKPGWQMDMIRTVCESGLPLVLQNGQYDRGFLRWHCTPPIRVDVQVFDAMLGWWALQPELAGKKIDVKRRRRTVKSLKFLASVYTRDAWWKDYLFDTEAEKYRLCGVDCCITLDVAQQQRRQLVAA